MDNINFTLAELTRIKLEPGEVLAVKLYGDDFEIEHLEALRNNFKALFPNNKTMIFTLPNGIDLQMEAISPNMEIDEKGQKVEISQEERERREAVLKREQELIDALNALPKVTSPCAEPANYCNDCGCGKKERIENGK